MVVHHRTGGAENYRADLPDAQVHVLDGGHFVLDTCADEAAALIRGFLSARGGQ